MLALIFDALGSYLLTRKISRWLYLIPLAVLLGIVSSFTTNLAMHYIWRDTFPAFEAAMSAITGSVLHSFFCMFCMWWFRRKKIVVPDSHEERVSKSIETAQKEPESTIQYQVESAQTLPANPIKFQRDYAILPIHFASRKTPDPILKFVPIASSLGSKGATFENIRNMLLTSGCPRELAEDLAKRFEKPEKPPGLEC